MDPKFKDPKKNPLLNDVDWFNFYYDFVKIFDGVKNASVISDKEIGFINPFDLNEGRNEPTFILKEAGHVLVARDNPFDYAKGDIVSKFMLFSKLHFKDDWQMALGHVAFFIRKKEIPYIRVGTTYFKIIPRENRFGASGMVIKAWKKEEIKEDHGQSLIKVIPRWDDFTIVPNNMEHSPTIKNCYNLYSPFPHVPFDGEVSEKDIPTTIHVMRHIFGDQFDIGMKYMKILYEDPTQILPVLVLASTERETGKTTFLNWVHMIFGENAVLISPQELTSPFNTSYSTKNIIMVDETVIEKSQSVERLKSLATAKTISVSEKWVSQYSIPFYGKIIICTNKEKDFMRVDEEEIRFWIRKVNLITGKRNTNIEDDLFNEIPKFLKYLKDIPSVDKSKSRMVFTMEEIGTHELKEVKDESKSWLRKEIEILVEDIFMQHPGTERILATAKDIKTRFFPTNNQVTISYIRKVIKNEMKLPSTGVERYVPFECEQDPSSPVKRDAVGRPFIFTNSHIQAEVKSEELAWDF